MKDFRILNAMTLLTVRSVSPVRGFLPPTVIVIGEHLDLASQVFYNDVEVSEFVVQTSTRLLVRIPLSQVGQDFKSIRVLSSTNVTRQNALLSFGLQRPLGTLSGLDRLVQSWMMIFMSNPGSDAWDPLSGGGAKTIVGRPTDRQGTGVAADLAVAIDRTKTELIRKQAMNSNVPLSEKLLSSSLAAISFDETSGTLTGQVILTNALGSSAQVAVGN